MQKKISKRNIITSHISENKIYYICIFVVFSLGILIGTCTATSFDVEYVNGVNEYFSSVFASLKDTGSTEMFRKIFVASFKEITLVWCMGFMIFGCIPVLYIIFKRGFILGVTVTFLINLSAEKGLLISALLMFFQCFLCIPVLFFDAALSMRLSAGFLDKLVSRSNYNFDLKATVSRYLLVFAACFLAVVFYSLLESFVSFGILKRCFVT
ncbi:MAG: stage II sporulation protein M [Clostridia bacterium]|nr:stage II sporulation protein M [Clostridia bacterium]